MKLLLHSPHKQRNATVIMKHINVTWKPLFYVRKTTAPFATNTVDLISVSTVTWKLSEYTDYHKVYNSLLDLQTWQNMKEHEILLS